MKSLLVIPLFNAVAMAGIAVGLAAVGVHYRLADPLYAGFIGAVTGVMGVVPIILGRPSDQAIAFQFALLGSVLHLLLSLAMGVTLMAGHAVGHDSQLGFWLLGAYWISLGVMIQQLRRHVLAAPLAKAEK